jgi:hypothetical protein
MTGERTEHSPKPCLFLRRQHEAFQIPKPDHGGGMMGENSTRRLHELVQRESRKVNPLSLLRNGDSVYCQH